MSPSLVVGVAERTITGSAHIKTRLPFFSQKGEAERTIVCIDGNIKSDDSRIQGALGEREIHNIVDPILGETRLYAGNNRPWQLTGSTNVEQIFDQNADPIVRPRVGGENSFNPLVYQTVGFQEAIPVYRRILVRAPRKFGGK